MEQDFTTLLQVHLDEPYKKLEASYGLRIAKSLYEQTSTQFFRDRMAKWNTNIRIAKGDMDMANFKKWMNMEGNDAYVQLDYTAPQIFAKSMENLLGGFMNRKETPEVDAIDGHSLSKKQEEQLTALFRMKHKQELDAMQEDSGQQLIPDGAMIPEDMDAFNTYFSLEARLPEEAMFRSILNMVMFDNDEQQLKKQYLRDSATCNIMVSKLCRDAEGNIVEERCYPLNVVHNLFTNENGKNQLQFIGTVKPLKVKDARVKYKLDEKTVFEIAKKSSNVGVINLYWNDSYLDNNKLRPYDDYSVMVFDFEIKTVDNQFFVVKKDANDSPIVNNKKSKPNPVSENNIPINKPIENIYEGIWVIDSDIMLTWGIGKDLITPYSNYINKKFKHTIFIPNNDGNYMPSWVERAITPVRQIILTRLKIQHLVVELKPSGLAIDFSTLGSGLDIGSSADRLEILKIYNTKGTVFYSSEGDDPSNPRKGLPITELNNGADVAKLNQLVNIHNFWVDILKNDLGSNDAADGTSLPSRFGEGVAQAQIQAFNNATHFIYNGYLRFREEVYNKVCMMSWDDVVLKAKKFNITENVNTDLMPAEFKVRVRMLPTDEELARFQEMLNNCIKAGSIEPDEAFRFMKTAKENIDLANMQLNREAKKRREKANSFELEKIDAANKGVAETAKTATESKIALLQEELKTKGALQHANLSGEKEIALINFATEMQKKAFELNKPIPTEIQQSINYIMQNALMPMQQEQAMEEQKAMVEQQEMEQPVEEEVSAIGVEEQ